MVHLHNKAWITLLTKQCNIASKHILVTFSTNKAYSTENEFMSLMIMG